MAETMSCDIVTPVKTIYSDAATLVRLPGELGSFGVMQMHEPLVSALQPGVVSITPADAAKTGKVEYIVSGGYAQIDGERVIVLANDALDISEIDVAKAREELAKVEDIIAKLAADDSSAAYYKEQKAWFDLQLNTVKG
ncbi:MAG: ATP synthase F1 subunit epsilon [Coriobacteriales bacterium]|nr:ATP synthase F1 subunit epsilon [Coriobacteriales bacterium]